MPALAEPPALSGEITNRPPVKNPVNVGQPIVYYSEADRASSTPRPAVCDARDGKQHIAVILLQNGTCRRLPSVRHIDDEFFVKNPSARHREGAWDYVEWTGPQFAAQQAQAYDDEAADLFGGEEGEQLARRVLQAHEEGKTPKQIAQRVSMKGVTAERIAAFLAIHNAGA